MRRALYEWQRRHFWLATAATVAVLAVAVVLVAVGTLPAYFLIGVALVALVGMVGAVVDRDVPWEDRYEWRPPPGDV